MNLFLLISKDSRTVCKCPNWKCVNSKSSSIDRFLLGDDFEHPPLVLRKLRAGAGLAAGRFKPGYNMRIFFRDFNAAFHTLRRKIFDLCQLVPLTLLREDRAGNEVYVAVLSNGSTRR